MRQGHVLDAAVCLAGKNFIHRRFFKYLKTSRFLGFSFQII